MAAPGVHVITPARSAVHASARGTAGSEGAGSAHATGAANNAANMAARADLSTDQTFVRSVRISMTLYWPQCDRFQYRSVPVPCVDGDHGCIIGA